MQEFLKNLAALIKVKTIVTFVIIGIFAALALTREAIPEDVMQITLVVVAFYFGTQLEKK